MGLNISICLYYLILHVKHVLSDLNKLCQRQLTKEIPSRTYMFLIDYHTHGTKLQAVKDVKYLVVTISSDLPWNTHVDIATNKATTSLKSLKGTFTAVHQRLTVKDKCYKSLVWPIMESASCVWDPHIHRNINK